LAKPQTIICFLTNARDLCLQEVPADVRLLDSLFLEIDESSLSGESAPVSKDASAIQSPEESPGLLESPGMALARTVVTRGKGIGVVIATGGATEMGRMMGLVKKAKEKKTPLQALLKEVRDRDCGSVP
jgi:Ca2+-transporting ATPase